jgi:signal transduction histidine kinase
MPLVISAPAFPLGSLQILVKSDFFTTQGPQRLGLGLSVTHGIIQQHRGGARIESVEGRGTTVTFSLPVGQEQTEST